MKFTGPSRIIEWGLTQRVDICLAEQDGEQLAFCRLVLPMKEIGFTVRAERLSAMLKELMTMELEKKFWEVVESCGWGTKTTNSKEVKRYLLRNFSQAEIQALEAVFRQYTSKLSEHLSEVTGVSDDSFSDLCSHIVGLGKKEYDAVMKDADLAQQRINRSDYAESFSYVWPHEDDYEKINGGMYLFHWAARIAEAYSAVLQMPAEENEIFSDYILPKIREDIELVVKTMSAFVSSHNYDEFLSQKEKVVRAVIRVEQLANKLNDDSLGDLKSRYWVINLFNDTEEALTWQT
jgi:hypothetical protein